MMTNAMNQKDWADQQVRERNYLESQIKAEEDAYAHQTETITRMRGIMEDENTIKRQQAYKELQAYNQRLALEKRMREESWKQDQAHQDKLETTLTDHHENLSAFGKTTRTAWTKFKGKSKKN